MIKRQEAWQPTAEVCRKPATSYNLKAKFSGLEVSEARRLRPLEEEDSKLDTRNNRDFGGAMIHLVVDEVSGAI